VPERLEAKEKKPGGNFWLNPPYWIEFFKNTANENEPPRIKFATNGTEYMGPPKERTVATLNARVGPADQPPTRLFGEPPPGGDTAAAAAGTARPARPNPANEPPPAFIGGRVVSVAPAAPGGGAAAEGRRPRGDIQVLWRKYRGPGDVKIADDSIALENGGGAKKFAGGLASTALLAAAPRIV